MMELLLHLLSHKEKKDKEEMEDYLLQLSFDENDCSWREYVIHFIGKFTLWVSRSGGFEVSEDKDSHGDAKLEGYKVMAFKTTTSALCLFSMVNKSINYRKYDTWQTLNIQNASLIFNMDNAPDYPPDDFLLFVPQEARSNFYQSALGATLQKASNRLNLSEFSNRLVQHPDDGFTIIEGTIHPSNTERRYLQLVHTVYNWNHELKDYCNEKVFCEI